MLPDVSDHVDGQQMAWLITLLTSQFAYWGPGRREFISSQPNKRSNGATEGHDMTTSKKTQTTAPLAHRVPAEVSDLIATYGAWLEEQTGQKIDSMSVYLGSQLRGTFQKSEGNQARLAAATAARIKREADRAEAQAARQAEADKKAAEPKADKPAPKRPTVKADKPVPATKAPARRRPTKPAAVATTNEAVQA